MLTLSLLSELTSVDALRASEQRLLGESVALDWTNFRNRGIDIMDDDTMTHGYDTEPE